MAPKRKSTRNTRLQPAATTASVTLAAASTTDADTSRPIGNNNQGGTYKEFCSCMIGSFNETEGADAALTWWNNHLKSAGIYTTYAMPWEHFKEMELALLYPKMVPTEARLKERYIKGLPPSIKGDVTASKTTKLHKTIEVANQLMDQVIEDTPEKVVENKRKW
ncbi:hypothetical protein Tco_0943987 [Tanacetum coccineum]